jgi:hypothetical protein
LSIRDADAHTYLLGCGGVAGYLSRSRSLAIGVSGGVGRLTIARRAATV